MERGILMEVRGRQGILLTGTGEFRRVELATGKWRVGEEIAAPLARAGRPWVRHLVAVAAAALLLIGGPAGYWQWSLLQPSVVLAMEINPTLEFTINGKGKVIAARGLNADGVAVLDGMTWQNLPVADVVQAATSKAIEMGKLDPTSAEGAIVLTAAPIKGEELTEAQAQVITHSAQTAAETAVKVAAAAKGKTAQAQVATTPTTKSEVEEARTEGLTLPEYILYKSLQESHPEVTPETFQQKGPGAVLKELGILPSEVLPSIKGRGKDDGVDQSKTDSKGQGQTKKDQKGDKKPANNGQRPSPDDHSTKGGTSDKPGNNGNASKPGTNGNANKPGNGGASDKPGNGKGSDKGPGSSSGTDEKESGSLAGVGLPSATPDDDAGAGPGNDDKGNDDPDTYKNGSDDKSNGKGDKGNGNDDKGNGNDDKSNGNDDKSNGKGDKGNGNDDKGNGKGDKGQGNGSGKKP